MLFVRYVFVGLVVKVFRRWFDKSFVCLCVRLFVYRFVCLCVVCLFVCFLCMIPDKVNLFDYLFVRSFVCLCV